MAFTGHAVFLRGDIVQILFNKVPVIISHNTNERMKGATDDAWGLSRVVTPDTYEEMFFPLNGGTTAWIIKKDQYKGLIEALRKYAETI